MKKQFVCKMSMTGHGPEYTFHLTRILACTAVRPVRFAEFMDWGAIVRHAGPAFTIAEYLDTGGSTSLILKVSGERSPETIDRDSAWHDRQELASALPALLADRADLTPPELHHDLPQALVTAVNCLALGSGATEECVLRAFHTNSQSHFDKTVGSILAGQLEYDVADYARQGPTHPGYSHILHFSWLYTRGIQIVEEAIQQSPGAVVTVVDVGTGGGNFLLALMHHLGRRRLLSRVRLVGIDRTDRDARFGRKLAGGRVEFLTGPDYDLIDPRFADRLRTLRPEVVVCNHVLEHLPVEGDVKNRYVHDLVLAAGFATVISVPLEDDPRKSVSEHSTVWVADGDEETRPGRPRRLSVGKLGRDMEFRVASAVETRNFDVTKLGGLIAWVRKPGVRTGGGFEADQLLTLQPRDTPARLDPVLRADFAEPFSPRRFNMTRRAQKIGQIRDEAGFARQGQEPRQVRQLLIRMPGTPVKLPGELDQFREAVQMIIDHNRGANPDYDHAYMYLNVFRGLTRFDSYRGLSRDVHGDQLQSFRPGYAYRPDWSYIVSSCLPTILYEQPFDVTDVARRTARGEQVNLYDVLRCKADEGKVYRTDNYGVYLLSPYVAHCATDADRDTHRVFLKVAVSTRRFFDNRELRRSPAFDIDDWYRVPTVGRIGGWLAHDHWGERYLQADVCPDWLLPDSV